VLKGLTTAEDACIAIEHGVDWVYVSNHGCRHLDSCRGSMAILPEVADAVAGRAKVIVDGSFRYGTDIIKAIAAGADLVGLGQLQCYALAAGGEAGIVQMLELIEDEIQRSMAMLGVATFDDLNRSYLHKASPTTLWGSL
jgi:glycolate oxidase